MTDRGSQTLPSVAFPASAGYPHVRMEIKPEIKMIKMKFNWLFFLILDGVFGLLGFAYIYSILIGPIKQGNVTNQNAWLIIAISISIPLFAHFIFRPFTYFFIEEKGIGSILNLGFWKVPFFKGIRAAYFEWSEIDFINYVSSPIISGIVIGRNNKSFMINLNFINNKKKAIGLLLKMLPREKATPDAEELFFKKWEQKLQIQ
jgi:hypothetical protein